MLLFLPGTHFSKSFSWVLLMTLRFLIISNLSKPCSCLCQWARPLLHHLKSSQTLIPIFGIWMWPLWLQRSHHFPWSVDHPIYSQRSSYLSKPWICKNIAKSYAIFFICDLFLFLSFWGIKSKGIASHLLNSCELVELIIMPNPSSRNYIGHN